MMRALRVQHEWVMAGGEHGAHDAELYTIVAANYASLLYRAAGRRSREPKPLDPDLIDLSTDFDAQFPRLREFRNFMGHPPFMEREPGEAWHLFSDGAWVLGPDGSARAIIDVELDHGFVETIHAEVVAILGGSD